MITPNPQKVNKFQPVYDVNGCVCTFYEIMKAAYENDSEGDMIDHIEIRQLLTLEIGKDFYSDSGGEFVKRIK